MLAWLLTRNLDLEQKSGMQQTALMVAVARKDGADFARKLICAGAKVDTVNDKNWSALHYALNTGIEETATILLQKKPALAALPTEEGSMADLARNRGLHAVADRIAKFIETGNRLDLYDPVVMETAASVKTLKKIQIKNRADRFRQHCRDAWHGRALPLLQRKERFPTFLAILVQGAAMKTLHATGAGA